MAPRAAPRIARVLAGRLPFGHGVIVGSSNGSIAFRPGDALALETSDEVLVAVDIPPALLVELTEALRPVAGTYLLAGAPPSPGAPGLAVRIAKSIIHDQDGSVVEEIG